MRPRERDPFVVHLALSIEAWFGCGLQPGAHSFVRHAQNPFDIGELDLGKIVEISKTVLEVAAACGVLNRETHLLQCHTAVVVAAEHVDARFLQRAEQASLPRRLIVLALAIVLAIPDRVILQQRFRSDENGEIVGRDRLVSLFAAPSKPDRDEKGADN
jgi:hypothetical protein